MPEEPGIAELPTGPGWAVPGEPEAAEPLAGPGPARPGKPGVAGPGQASPGEPGNQAEIRSAGGLVWRPGPAGPEVCLVHRPRYDDWSFPKGKLNDHEHVLLAAVREVREETGIAVVLGRRLPTARYLARGRPKRVDYWAARALAGDGFQPNSEVDSVAWLPLAAARERLSYAHDSKVLAAFAAGPPATAPLILLRHAAAADRAAWRAAGHRDDLARPLSARGQEQAAALAAILGCFPAARVASSAAERCLATVRPYAARAGQKVVAQAALTVAGGGWEPSAAARELTTALATSGEPVIICGHRENLSVLLAWACEALGAPVPGWGPLAPGAFWVLHREGGRLAAAEQHEPGV
jgi:8-oxo-dGTP pyrophosphatase MutT (NUDIX family)/phosphohistidine phosphatase SixA